MNKFQTAIISAVSLLLLGSAPAFAATDTNATNQDQSCAIKILGSSNTQNTNGSRYTVANGMATTTVEVTGPTDCVKTVTLASWRAPTGSSSLIPIKDQVLVTSKTETFAPGQHTMTIPVADCTYQVDLVLGTEPTNNGTPLYDNSQMIGYTQNANKVCADPAPVAPASVAPTPPPAAVQPVVAAPTTLVNTGAGSTIALFAAVTAVGTMLHQIVSRKRTVQL